MMILSSLTLFFSLLIIHKTIHFTRAPTTELFKIVNVHDLKTQKVREEIKDDLQQPRFSKTRFAALQKLFMYEVEMLKAALTLMKRLQYKDYSVTLLRTRQLLEMYIDSKSIPDQNIVSKTKHFESMLELLEVTKEQLKLETILYNS
uniref:Uncharacterized protein n=1 Tax=Clastoptera arizonana TaxID=38151 RepID=A0A1B6CMP1_9HEMI